MSGKQFYTVPEFAELMDLNEEFVRQMCREQEDPRSGNRYHLPPGWEKAKVASRVWVIYRKDSQSSSMQKLLKSL